MFTMENSDILAHPLTGTNAYRHKRMLWHCSCKKEILWFACASSSRHFTAGTERVLASIAQHGLLAYCDRHFLVRRGLLRLVLVVD
mmetsp:Transcript_27253/g.67616  ORF Transcript_27253/g.67616 Transcript_27253/m.67616 type:complete len:86 (-) Transcript_27253:854-1111(-)